MGLSPALMEDCLASPGVARWVDENVEDLRAHAYTQITAEPYEPRGVYGDQRVRR